MLVVREGEGEGERERKEGEGEGEREGEREGEGGRKRERRGYRVVDTLFSIVPCFLPYSSFLFFTLTLSFISLSLPPPLSLLSPLSLSPSLSPSFSLSLPLSSSLPLSTLSLSLPLSLSLLPQHILKKAREWGMGAKVIAELKFDIPKMYDFHKHSSVDVYVDLIRFDLKDPTYS